MNEADINYIKDNNEYLKEKFIEKYKEISNKLLDKTLESLEKESNFLIFPENFYISDDLDKNNIKFFNISRKFLYK